MKKYINSRTIFLSSLICIVLIFYSLSYNFFLTNFIHIENIQNEKNIHNLVNHFNSNFDSLVNVSNTFKQNGFNIPHIENLNQLGLDFIIYQNSNNKNIFHNTVKTLKLPILHVSKQPSLKPMLLCLKYVQYLLLKKHFFMW